jgi:hypothetical protein
MMKVICCWRYERKHTPALFAEACDALHAKDVRAKFTYQAVIIVGVGGNRNGEPRVGRLFLELG